MGAFVRGGMATEVSVAAAQAAAISAGYGVGQTTQDVTASRVSGVTYTNSTGKPIYVFVYALAFTSWGIINFYKNGIYVLKQNVLNIADYSGSLQVLNGETYRFDITNGNLTKCFEIR